MSDKKRVTIKVGDNNNSSYKSWVKFGIDVMDYLVLKYGQSEGIFDLYDEVWERLCNKVSLYGDNLPEDWYVAGIEYDYD